MPATGQSQRRLGGQRRRRGTGHPLSTVGQRQRQPDRGDDLLPWGAAAWLAYLQPMAAEDASLIERILDGDDEAFDALVGRHLDRGRAIAGSIVPDGSAVDDIVQEAFIRAHRALGSLSDPIAFPAWFGRIVHNEAITWLRRNRRRHQVAIEDEGRLVAPEDSGPDLAAEERGHRLRQALDKLRPAYRQILALKYEARLSYEEIADTLGLSLANVEKKLYRARQRLQQLMDQ